MLCPGSGITQPDDMRILLIEDDRELAAELRGALTQQGWSVEASDRGEHFAPTLQAEHFDVAVLDIGLPGIDGFTALRRARAAGCATPVLMLTARDAVTDRVHGLETGADDYLVKPFALAELVARLRVLARRHQPRTDRSITHGALVMNCDAGRAYLGDEPLELSRREWAVLECLAANAERVVAKEALVRALESDEGSVSINAVEVYVCRVRAKIEPAGMRIRTVRGFGYMLAPAALAPPQ